MENIIIDNDIIDNDLNDYDKIEVPLITVEKFIFLTFITFGLYQIWWTYKAWKFVKETDRYDVYPVLRTLFGVIFLFDLFKWINFKANFEMNYGKSFNILVMYLIVILLNLASRIDSIAYISLFSVIGYIMPFQSMNYIKENTPVYYTYYINGFNTRQIILIVLGLILWSLIFINFLSI